MQIVIQPDFEKLFGQQNPYSIIVMEISKEHFKLLKLLTDSLTCKKKKNEIVR